MTAVDDVLHVHQAAQAQVTRDADRVIDDVVELAPLQTRWIDRVRVAGVDPSSLDMLHHAGNDDRLPIRDRVHLDLQSLEVLVNQDLAARHGADRPAHVPPQLVAVAHDLHRAPAQHIRRPHQHRVAGAFGDGLGLRDGGGRAAHGLRDADRVERAGKGSAVLREVDGLDARAHDGDGCLVEGLGEVDRRLAAELHQRAGDTFGLCYMKGAVEVERFEVEAVRGVEVGRDRFWVGVDHHSPHAGLTQRPRGVDRAVIELDALADSNRSGPDDQHGAHVNGIAFGLFLPA